MTSQVEPSPEDRADPREWGRLLDFWFAPELKEKWFEPDSAFDERCRREFTGLVARAEAVAGTRAARDGHEALALVILLDQMPRNIWRGSARCFAHDVTARHVAVDALARGLDRDLEPDLAVDGRLFLYLPLEHSEDLDDQHRAVALFRALGDEKYLDYAVRHERIIERFGRFPHRNAVLNRASTPEEVAFLQEPGSSF